MLQQKITHALICLFKTKSVIRKRTQIIYRYIYLFKTKIVIRILSKYFAHI